MADEVFVVSHMLCSFTGGKVDFVNVHGIRISGRLGSLGVSSRGDVAIPSPLEFPQSYHVSVELSSFVEPLFPFPTCLFLSVGESYGRHHDS